MVMVGVVLFAALMFVFSRGARQGGGNLSEKQEQLAAQEIIDYAQKVERTVNRLLLKECSENNISFFMPGIAELAAYVHGTEIDACNVFHGEGGGLGWKSYTNYTPDASVWKFSADQCIPEIGTGGADCETVGSGADDLIMILKIKPGICTSINDLLNHPATPQTAAGHDWIANVPFAGTYGGAHKLDNNEHRLAGCFQGSGVNAGTYYFFQTLIAR